MDFVNLNDQLVNVAQVARGCPGATLRRAYSRALREWCQQTQWLRLNLPGQTTAGASTYLLGNDQDLDIIGVRAVSMTRTYTNGQTNTWGLGPSDSTRWNPNVQPNEPRFYQYVAEGAVAVYPPPDAVYGMEVSLIVMPKESSDIAAQIPQAPLIKYSNDIESGALAYLLAVPGTSWSDKAAAEGHRRQFQSSIANGKAEVQRAFNTGSVMARRRPFLVR